MLLKSQTVQLRLVQRSTQLLLLRLCLATHRFLSDQLLQTLETQGKITIVWLLLLPTRPIPFFLSHLKGDHWVSIFHGFLVLADKILHEFLPDYFLGLLLLQFDLLDCL